MRQQMLAEDPCSPAPGCERRVDELAAAQRYELRADEACGVEPCEEPDQERDGEHALVQDPERDPLEVRPRRARADEHQQKEDRQRHHDLAEPRNERVHNAAEHPCQGAQDDPDHERDHRREHPDLDRDLSSVEEPQREVPAERAVASEDEQCLPGSGWRRGDLAVIVHLRHMDVGHPGEGADGAQVDIDRVRERVVRAVAENARQDRGTDETGDDEPSCERQRDHGGSIAAQPRICDGAG